MPGAVAAIKSLYAPQTILFTCCPWECHLIIETETTILFLEVKKKTLTPEAPSGNIIKATQDVSKSLLHGLAQSGLHELLLRTKGEINFRDGTRLYLKN